MVNLGNDELRSKQLEEAISHIGAKVADAMELTQQTKVLSAKSEALLINVQQELEELYVTLDDNTQAIDDGSRETFVEDARFVVEKPPEL